MSMATFDRAFFIRLALFLLMLWAVTKLTTLFLWVFFAFTIAAAVEPLIHRLERPLGRGFSVFLSYMLIVAVIGLGIWVAAPVLAGQFNKLYGFVQNLPSQISIPGLDVDQQKLLENAFSTLSAGLKTGSKVLFDVVGNVSEAALALVLAIMLSLEPALIGRLSRFLPGDDWDEILTDTRNRMGYWARAQVAVAISFALLLGIWLTIVGVPTPWALALTGGVLEVVPFVGGITVAVLAAVVALGKSYAAAGLVLLGYGGIALLQGKILIPLIYGRTLGYHPAVVLLAIFMGGKLFGVMGVLLGVPGLILLHSLYKVWLRSQNNIERRMPNAER